MNKTISSLETSMQTTVRLLAGKYGINLVFGGNQACTDGETITLPTLPTELTPDDVTEINGFADHEVAHCRYTDFPFLTRTGYINELHQKMVNMTEDSRIEILQVQDFPGCAVHLDFINAKWGGINAAGWTELPAAFRIISNVRFIMEDQDLRLDSDIKPAFTNKVLSLCLMLKLASDTKEIHGLCKKIVLEMFKALENQPKKEEPKKPEESEDKADEPEGKGDESEGTDEGQGSGGKGEGEPSDEEGDGDGGEGEGDGEPLPEAGKGEGSIGPEDLTDPSHYRTDVPTDIHSYFDELIRQLLEAAKKENEAVFDSEMPDTEIATSGKHMPASTQYDTLIDYTKERNPAYAKLAAEMRPHSTKVATEIEQLLTIEADEHWRYEREGGKLNKRSLVKLATTPGYLTPFKEHVSNDIMECAVMGVFDESGSMGSVNKINIARETAVVLGEALKTLDIPFEIGGFTTEGSQLPGTAGLHNRMEPLRHILYKSFDTDSLQGLVNMRAQNNNCDGESVRFFGERLLQHQAERKIMFVFSDGYPAAHCNSQPLLNKDLRDAVKEMEACGIEVVAFGIASESVKRFYTNHVVVNNVADLPKIVANELKKILTKE